MLLAVWLVFVTTFGLHHDAEHTFHRHTHYGQACPVFDFCEHKDLATHTPAVTFLLPPRLPLEDVLPAIATPVPAQAPAFARSRAPPAA